MNIVFLSPEPVYPANTGGRIVVYNKIKYLAKMGHKVYLLCVVDTKDEIALQRNELHNLHIASKYYNRNAYGASKYLHNICLPFAVGSRTINRIKSDLQNTLAGCQNVHLMLSFLMRWSIGEKTIIKGRFIHGYSKC